MFCIQGKLNYKVRQTVSRKGPTLPFLENKLDYLAQWFLDDGLSSYCLSSLHKWKVTFGGWLTAYKQRKKVPINPQTAGNPCAKLCKFICVYIFLWGILLQDSFNDVLWKGGRFPTGRSFKCSQVQSRCRVKFLCSTNKTTSNIMW